MLIILDSNILIKDFYMRKANMQLLRKFGKVIIPEIVYDEVRNKHRERLEAALVAISRKIDEYNDLVPEKAKIDGVRSLEEEMKSYDDFLTCFMLEMGAYPPEAYPDISHKDVVARALTRKKPFKADGKDGYRDFLLWCTVLDLLKYYAMEEIHFISENTSDFADSSNRFKLHEQLIDDMRNRGISEERLVFWPCLKDFIEKIVKTQLEREEEEGRFAKTLQADDVHFVNPIDEFIHNELTDCSIDDYEVFVPGDSPIVHTHEQVAPFEIDDIAVIDEDRFFIEGKAQYYSVIRSTASASEIQMYPKELLERSRVEYRNDGSCEILTEVVIDVALNIIFNKKDNAIESKELIHISDSTLDVQDGEGNVDSFEPESKKYSNADTYIRLLKDLGDYVTEHYPKYAKYVELINLLGSEYDMKTASQIMGKADSTLYDWVKRLRPIYDEFRGTIDYL